MEEKGNYLAVVPNREVTPSVWNLIKEMAPVMHQARLFGVTSPDQAAAIMLKGYELGIGITASFELIQVIDGRPTLSPRGALALLHTAPEIKTIKTTRLVDAAGKFLGYECYMERSNGFSHTARFTMQDAAQAGLTAGSDMGDGKKRQGRGNWEKYPENMCMWRAIGFCADTVAPDITAGLTASMKMPEALGAGIDDNGNLVIEGNVQETVITAPVPTPAPAAPLMTLEQLLQLFGPDAVLAANGGKFPTSDQEVAAICLKLGGAA